jgi:hypothetical protein
MGEKRNAYRILGGMSEGKRPLGRQDVGGWTILKEWDGVDWTDLAENRNQWRVLVNTVMNLRVP